MNRVKGFFYLLLTAGRSFIDDRALKMSASLAYCTVFSLAPMLLIIISLTGWIFGEDAIRGRVFQSLNDFLGNHIALQIQEMIKRISLTGNSGWALLLGGLTLFIGATGVFTEIQDSLNQIWRVKATPAKGWKKLVMSRLLSFSLIIALGFLLMVSLIINGLVMMISGYLQGYFPEISLYIANLTNITLTFFIVGLLFAIVYKFLPDVRLKWRHIKSGAVITTILFMLGHYLFGLYIRFADPGYAYGAAGSLVVLLLWVYYSAAILYFGAEFTRAYTKWKRLKIKPEAFATKTGAQ